MSCDKYKLQKIHTWMEFSDDGTMIRNYNAASCFALLRSAVEAICILLRYYNNILDDRYFHIIISAMSSSLQGKQGLRAMEQISSNIFDFFPDRDHLDIFSMRVPREAVSPRAADSINVKIKNDQGYTCAEKTGVRELEIRGLPCDQCMRGRLHVTIEPRNQSQILSKTESIVLDESRRAEICNLRPEHRRQEENMTITTIKRRQEDGCRWLFRGGRIGCCYSNRNFYKQSGGCNPFMQSPACREGSEIPIVEEEANTCTLHISNLDVKDSGNYLLSNDDRGTPTFKINLVVRCKM